MFTEISDSNSSYNPEGKNLSPLWEHLSSDNSSMSTNPSIGTQDSLSDHNSASTVTRQISELPDSLVSHSPTSTIFTDSALGSLTASLERTESPTEFEQRDAAQLRTAIKNPKLLSDTSPNTDTETETDVHKSSAPNHSHYYSSKIKRFTTHINNKISSIIPTTEPSPDGKVFIETLSLAPTRPVTLLGSVLVQNLAPEKSVFIHFTLDNWKTTSEIACQHICMVPIAPSFLRTSHADPNPSQSTWERFSFSIDLDDIRHHLVDRVLIFAVKYIAAQAGEWWDNNNGRNYKVHFEAVESSDSPALVFYQISGWDHPSATTEGTLEFDKVADTLRKSLRESCMNSEDLHFSSLPIVSPPAPRKFADIHMPVPMERRMPPEPMSSTSSGSLKFANYSSPSTNVTEMSPRLFSVADRFSGSPSPNMGPIIEGYPTSVPTFEAHSSSHSRSNKIKGRRVSFPPFFNTTGPGSVSASTPGALDEFRSSPRPSRRSTSAEVARRLTNYAEPPPSNVVHSPASSHIELPVDMGPFVAGYPTTANPLSK